MTAPQTTIDHIVVTLPTWMQAPLMCAPVWASNPCLAENTQKWAHIIVCCAAAPTVIWK